MSVEQRRELARRKVDHAITLRTVRRFTYDRIAESMLPCPVHYPDGAVDCSLCLPRLYANAGTARRAIVKALSAEHELSEEQRRLAREEQLASLDAMLRETMSRATAPDDIDADGNPVRSGVGGEDRARFVRESARLLDQRAKLLGLYAPTRVTVSDELDEALRAELAMLSETPLPTADQLAERPGT